MGGGQRVVVVEHGALKLKVFLEEWHGLDFLGLLLVAGVGFGEGGDLLDEPEVGGLRDVLVAVDFLLFVAPVWERLRVRPHCDLGGVMDQLEEAGHGAEVLVLFAVFKLDFEEGVVVAVTLRFLNLNGGEFLVCGEPGGGDVVREEVGVGYDVAELDKVTILDGAVGILAFWDRSGREDNPVVVGVVERISGDLLACGMLVLCCFMKYHPVHEPWEEILPSSYLKGYLSG